MCVDGGWGKEVQIKGEHIYFVQELTYPGSRHMTMVAGHMTQIAGHMTLGSRSCDPGNRSHACRTCYVPRGGRRKGDILQAHLSLPHLNLSHRATRHVTMVTCAIIAISVSSK